MPVVNTKASAASVPAPASTHRAALAVMTTLFFAGWHGPWDIGPIWFLLKTMVVLFVFIWLRTTLPRLRYDQLMRFGWKVLLPVATVNAVVTAALVVAFQ